MYGFDSEDEETLFEERQQKQLDYMLNGSQKNMQCPVCNAEENVSGTHFHNVNALLQHSKAIKNSDDPAKRVGHRQQAQYILEFLKRQGTKKNEESSNSRNCGNQYHRQGNNNSRDGYKRSDVQSNSSNTSSEIFSNGKEEEQIVRQFSQRGSVKLTVGTRREREQDTADWQFREASDVLMQDTDNREPPQKQMSSNRAFPEGDEEFEVWPPVIIVQGIQATYKSQDSKWWPVEVENNQKLSELIFRELGFSSLDFKIAPKILFGSRGVSVDDDAGILTIGQKQFGLGLGYGQLNEKAVFKLINFYQKTTAGQKGRESWEQFKQKWGVLCGQEAADFLPKQQTTLFAYQAVPSDISAIFSDSKNFQQIRQSIVQKDQFRGDPERLRKQIEESKRKLSEVQAAKGNMVSHFENKVQEKQMQCISLQQVIKEREYTYNQKQQIVEELEQKNSAISEENEKLKEQVKEGKESFVARTNLFQHRIAELHKQSNNKQSTHDAQMSALTRKLQMMKMESAEELRKRNNLEKYEKELEKKQLELEKVQLQQKEKELQNKELMMDIELLQRELSELELGGENNPNQSNQEVLKYQQQVQEMEKKIEEKMKIMGFGFSLQDLKNYEMECQICREKFIPSEYEPDWGKIEETRYDISERKKRQQEWRENVRARFYTRFDCKYGCSGVCFSCSEILWKQAGEIARKNRVKTRYCPYCKQQWKSKPEPFVVYVRG